jgi:hypothetical protein
MEQRDFVSREEFTQEVANLRSEIRRGEDVIRLQAELDTLHAQYTIVQEVFGRVISSLRTVTVDTSEAMEQGDIRWSEAQTPSGSKELTIWFEPASVVDPVS